MALHYAAGAGCLGTIEALLVISSSSMIDAKDKEGNTALHVACREGQDKAVKLLLSRGCDVTACNTSGMTCLDVAVEFGRENVAAVIVENEKPDSLFEVLRVKDQYNIVPLKTLIEKMPAVAERVLDRCVTYSDHPTDHPDFTVTFDYRLLEHHLPPTKGRRDGERFFAPTTMVENKRKDLLTHPLSQTLLQWKWSSLGKAIYWLDFVLFLLYLCTFTHFLVAERSRQRVFDPHDDHETARAEDEKIFGNKTAYSKYAPAFITVFICFNMLKEFYQMAVLRWRYLHLTNVFEWGCYILSLLVVVPHLASSNIYYKYGYFWPLASVSILLCYICCILFLRRISFFGLYITMFTEVLKTLMRVLSVSFLFILAFALAFFLLLKEQVSAQARMGLSLPVTSLQMRTPK